MVKRMMSESLEKKLDEETKEKSCCGKSKGDDRILNGDKKATGNGNNSTESSLPCEDRGNYITKDEDNFSVMINGSY